MESMQHEATLKAYIADGSETANQTFKWCALHSCTIQVMTEGVKYAVRIKRYVPDLPTALPANTEDATRPT